MEGDSKGNNGCNHKLSVKLARPHDVDLYVNVCQTLAQQSASERAKQYHE